MVNKALRVDFVNDRVPQYKSPIVLDNGYKIDNVENILSNKITAVISRDNPKDVFDIYLIARFYDFLWKDILKASQEKLAFTVDSLIYRLKTFPVELLGSIKLVDAHFLDNFNTDFPVIIRDIIEGRKNSLYKNSLYMK